ncbi:hypothetical protein XELAEV_18007528mg, partial [Xenopus laevis]
MPPPTPCPGPAHTPSRHRPPLRLPDSVHYPPNAGVLCFPAVVIVAKAFGGKVVDSSVLSKEEFIEKVRHSNEACKNGDFQLAINLYTETLQVDPQNCILYSNRSAAFLKIQQFEKSLDDAIKARLLNPKWPK